MNHTITTNKFAQSDIKKEKQQVIETKYEPSEMVINNILNYSKALSVKDSKHINFIEVVLN